MFKRGKTDKVWADNLRLFFLKVWLEKQRKIQQSLQLFTFCGGRNSPSYVPVRDPCGLQGDSKFSFKQAASFVLS